MRRTLLIAILVATFLSGIGLVAAASGGARESATILDVSPPEVGTAVAFDTTPPLSELKPVKPKGGEPKNIGESGEEFVEQLPHRKDGALQQSVPTTAMP